MPDFSFCFRHQQYSFGTYPAIMGIINITPDSFSDGGQFYSPEKALQHAQQMVTDGADFIDIGGESTRPGFAPISEKEELARVIPVIKAIRKDSNIAIPLSIDTRKANVADAALEAGADIVNDVSALGDPAMPAVIKKHSAGAILMHAEKLSATADTLFVVQAYLQHRLQTAMKQTGLSKEFFLLDPGIGFGKNQEQNLTLLRHCNSFRISGCGVLIGMSRKSFLGEMLKTPSPKERLAGTLSTALFCGMKGCEILRMHDVKETVQAFACQKILQKEFDV